MENKIKKFQDAVNYFDSLSPKEQEQVQKDCPDSWKKTATDFYDWLSDIHSKQIKKFVSPITYEDIANNDSSTVKLECTQAHTGVNNLGFGRISHYSYKKGDVLPRNSIINFKSKNWKLA